MGFLRINSSNTLLVLLRTPHTFTQSCKTSYLYWKFNPFFKFLSFDEESTNNDMFVSMLPLLLHKVYGACLTKLTFFKIFYLHNVTTVISVFYDF